MRCSRARKYDQSVGGYLLAAKVNKDLKPENIAKLKEAYEKGDWDGYGRMRQEIHLEELNAKKAKDLNGYVKALDYAYSYAWVTELQVSKTRDFVRDARRFKELVRRVGIPEAVESWSNKTYETLP